jgi:transcriptional regulator with XRE-family HTH domain
MKEFGNFRKKSWLLSGDDRRDKAVLKFLLDSAETTQQEVADNLGVTLQTVNQIVNRHGNSRAVFDYLERLAKQIEFKV